MARKKKTNLELLTELQIKQGFLPDTGVLSPIAILGYIGEAGEVAGEISTPKGEYHVSAKIAQVMYSARGVDFIKKEIRDKQAPPIEIVIANPDLLKSELADHFYYMNAVCIELGITHEELAEMAVKKELTYLDGKEPNKHAAPIGKQKKTILPAPGMQAQKRVHITRLPEIKQAESYGQTCSMEEGCLSCGS